MLFMVIFGTPNGIRTRDLRRERAMSSPLDDRSLGAGVGFEPTTFWL